MNNIIIPFDKLSIKGFKLYEIRKNSYSNTISHHRKDLYKMCLCTGNNMIQYPDGTSINGGHNLFFGSPENLYSWQALSKSCHGYACVFSADFLRTSDSRLMALPFFEMGGAPILELDGKERNSLAYLFGQMLLEYDGDYHYKAEIIRNYIHIILHGAQKIMMGSSNL